MKKKNQEYALKLILMTALDIHQDILLRDIEGKDRLSNIDLLNIIRILEEVRRD